MRVLLHGRVLLASGGMRKKKITRSKICERRGGETQARFIAQTVESAYGRRRGLRGFDGMVTYWKNFRILVEEALARLDVAKLSIENAAGNWAAYERAVFAFLCVSEEKNVAIPASLLKRFSGTYSCEKGGKQQSCLVLLENDALVVDGIEQVWPTTRLIPYADNLFAIESLPFLVTFEEDAGGNVTGMRITGPELLSGKVEQLFVRAGEH